MENKFDQEQSELFNFAAQVGYDAGKERVESYVVGEEVDLSYSLAPNDMKQSILLAYWAGGYQFGYKRAIANKSKPVLEMALQGGIVFE